MYVVVLFVAWLVISLVQIFFFKTDAGTTLLLNSLVINVGLGGLYAFIGHAFFADRVAEYIRWPKGSPFQFEVAVTNLGLGVLGILCVWLRGNFWIATIIAYSVFLLGAAFGHIRQMVKAKNLSAGNVGPVFVADILNPLILIVLAIIFSMPA